MRPGSESVLYKSAMPNLGITIELGASKFLHCVADQAKGANNDVINEF